MAIRIMLAGGGTGGHVYPLVAVAKEIQKEAASWKEGAEIRFIGSGELLQKEATALGLEYRTIMAPKWRRYFSVLNFLDLIKFPIGLVQSFWQVVTYMPDVMFSKGGYASLLPTLIARLMFIPIFIHESDTVPGKTNRLLGKAAKIIFTSFDVSAKYFDSKKVRLVGAPIRDSVLKVMPREQAVEVFKLDTQKPILFVTGGSQGASVMNDVLIEALLPLIKDFHIIHQCGMKHLDAIKELVGYITKEEEKNYGKFIRESYRLYGALDDSQMSAAYNAADIVVSRAGSAIHEIAALGKPAILVPITQSANNHQYENAQALVHHGAIVITEDNFTPHLLEFEIKKAYENRFLLADTIRDFAKVDAASKIARTLLEIVS